MIYGLIGGRLGHSFSREIHAVIAPYSYELKELREDEVKEFLEKRDFKGINVTLPYKQTVIPFLDEIDGAAKRIGAVNTIVNKNGRLYGYNTDNNGAAALIRTAGIEISGKKVLILGTGGTSKTLRTVVTDMNAREIINVSRHSSYGAVSYDEAKMLHSDAEVIINTTPVGMYPQTEETPISIAAFKKLEGVVDVIYNPLNTMLVRQARAKGIKAQGGLYMLAAQAVYASELFGEAKASDELTNKVFTNVLKGKQNIVLIGMPSSGKTTVGNALAQKMSRRLIDSDREIVNRAGCQISDIFAKNGEKYFRQLESETIAEISKEQGVIISTGGGVVLNPDNIDRLKANGLIFFLNRPLKLLIGTADRPLATNAEALKKLYEQRYDKYVGSADIIISSENGIPDVAENILKEFNK